MECESSPFSHSKNIFNASQFQTVRQQLENACGQKSYDDDNFEIWRNVFLMTYGLKLNIQKTKIMASGPITSWEIDGETVADFYFWGLQNQCRW